MIQKIIKVGNSIAVTIPKGFKDKKKWKAGQTIHVDEIPNGDGLAIYRDASKSGKYVLTPEFKEWLDQFNKKYKTALAELAKR